VWIRSADDLTNSPQSSLTRIRQQLSFDIFQHFFEKIGDLRQEARLVKADDNDTEQFLPQDLAPQFAADGGLATSTELLARFGNGTSSVKAASVGRL
jgi:hypothetical protein